ncbi:hypothetical protein L0657_09375 [Dyadobacter sp. CY345]|uniref:hypothetical protein n=1 Tax=Dyadobacter sp. CY345 TaxID=2909335 RepID=UPI001F245EB6|nr:hypothetical protein [Dyadobacter sp. CY345]MCF2444166.1 hypothetical protein [Dyadobacter sp. CY345]
MKKGYNESWVQNLFIQSTARSWSKNNLLTDGQIDQVEATYPESFYRPGIFVKIGLFLFTIFGGSFFAGFLSLFFFESAGNKTFAILCLISAVCYYFVLEFLIKERKLFHSGIDNALLYMANLAVITFLLVLFEGLEFWQYCLFVLLVNGITSLRYADLFTVFITITSVFVLFASFLIKFPIGKSLLPFAIMILSAAVYLLNKKIESLYYQECQKLIKIVVLITFYLGGNYYIVRQGNALLADLATNNAPEIPFAIVFYIFTAAIPLFYCLKGLKSKDRIFLVVGLLAVAFSCFTFRYYFDMLAIEIILCIAGSVLILFSLLIIHYLKTPRFGISDDVSEKRKLANLEALLIANQFGQAPEADSVKFGGGNFGGGGAGNDY